MIIGILNYLKYQNKSIILRSTIGGMFAFLILFAPSLEANGEEKISVITSTSDLAYFARQVGGERVRVENLVPGNADPHYVSARPDFILKASKADIFCYVGLDLEAGWLPAVLQRSRNGNIMAGGKGNCDASVGIQILERPAGKVDRSMGHMHVFGNPHYHLDPVNALIAARNIRDTLMRVDPDASEEYEANFQDFSRRLRKLTQEELNLFQKHRGLKVAVYHSEFSYLANRFGMNVAVSIEEKPGVPPSASYLAEVVKKMENEKIKVILVAPYNNQDYARSVAQRSGAKVIVMPLSVDSEPGMDSYEMVIQTMIKRVSEAVVER